MRKIYLSLGCALLMQLTSSISAQVLVTEDFSSATGTTPPSGWVNNDIEGGGEVWYFDNPGGQDLISPITDPAAVFDSDYNGSSSGPENAALESPSFDANVTGYLLLSFDHLYYDNDFGTGAEYFVEVWDGSSWVEVMSGGPDTDGTEHVVMDITSVANGASDAQVRFRYVGDWGYWWIVDNILVEVVTCTSVSDIVVSNETTSSVDLVWTVNGSEGLWNIEWGPVGFTPGTGTETGSATSNDVVYTVNGLNSGTTYDIYIQANCGSDSSYWTMATGTTLCAPLTSLPWTENFDAMQDVDFNLFPNCWYSEYGEWLSDNDNFNYTGLTPYSGTNFIAALYDTDDYIWTPEFELTAGSNYEFSFMFAGDGFEGWSGEVYVNSEQSSTDAIQVGDPFIESSEPTDTYRKAIFCFTPDSTGVYTFGVHVSSNFDPWALSLDDFSLTERGATAGTNGSMDVCQTEGLVDLNDIITKDDQNGTWSFAPNPATIVNDTLFNPQFVPSGTVYVNYITTGCMVDTASAIITIFGPSTAGDDGSISACKNQPLDLLSGLNGVVTLGGDWYDPTNTQLSSGQITTGAFPGSFNYRYISGNGVCPNDTAEVVVTITNCNWLAVGENELEGVNVYPNPSTGLVYIESTFSTGSFNLVITDVNGRLIDNKNNTISAGTNAIHLENAERGIYFFRLSNDSAEKVYRVVIE